MIVTSILIYLLLSAIYAELLYKYMLKNNFYQDSTEYAIVLVFFCALFLIGHLILVKLKIQKFIFE